MPVQSIDLSAVTDATFGGSAVEQINLNGAGIWTLPASDFTAWPTGFTAVDTGQTTAVPYADVMTGNHGLYLNGSAFGSMCLVLFNSKLYAGLSNGWYQEMPNWHVTLNGGPIGVAGTWKYFSEIPMGSTHSPNASGSGWSDNVINMNIASNEWSVYKFIEIPFDTDFKFTNFYYNYVPANPYAPSGWEHVVREIFVKNNQLYFWSYTNPTQSNEVTYSEAVIDTWRNIWLASSASDKAILTWSASDGFTSDNTNIDLQTVPSYKLANKKYYYSPNPSTTAWTVIGTFT